MTLEVAEEAERYLSNNGDDSPEIDEEIDITANGVANVIADVNGEGAKARVNELIASVERNRRHPDEQG